jgi:hypothetical protein
VPFARAFVADRSEDLLLAFFRVGLPSAAGEYVLDRHAHFVIVLTGLVREEAKALRALSESSSDVGREEFPAFIPGDQRSQPGTALLIGRKEQFERVIRQGREGGHSELAAALTAVLAAEDPHRAFEWAGFEFQALKGPRLAAGESASEIEVVDREIDEASSLTALPAKPWVLTTGNERVLEKALEKSPRNLIVRWRSSSEPGRQLMEWVLDSGASWCCIADAPESSEPFDAVLTSLHAQTSKALATGLPAGRLWVDPGWALPVDPLWVRRAADLRLLGHPVMVRVDDPVSLTALVLRGAADLIRVAGPHVASCVQWLARAQALRATKHGPVLDSPLAVRGSGP